MNFTRASLLLLVLTAATPAVSVVESVAIGDSLFRYELYSQAAAEYRRALFAVDSTGGVDGAVWLRLGLSQGAAQGAAAAAGALHRVAELDAALGFDAQLALAGLYAAEGKTDQSRLEVADLLLLTPDSSRRRQLHWHAAWLSLHDARFEDAVHSFRDAGRIDIADAVAASGARAERSPVVATLLSTAVPGSGEAYAGRPAFGLLALAVTGGSAAGTYLALRSGDWVTAAVIFTTFFLRFYNGSRANAAGFVEQRNRELAQRRARELSERFGPVPDWFAGVRWLGGPAYPPRLTTPGESSAPAR